MEKTKKCKHCQEEISAKASRCPKCQGDQRGWFRRHPFLTALLVIFVVMIGATMSSDPDTEQSPTSTEPAPAVESEEAPEEEVEAADESPGFGNGTHLVGIDIEPGTYRTRTGSSGCYYERLSGTGGTLDDILANDNTSYSAIVTILETDNAFRSSNCARWSTDLSAITDSMTEFSDGMYIVGTDIEPGTYRNEGSSGCYYERLAGFTGELDDIIANNNTDDQAIVTIATTDEGFKSTRCGTWTMVE